MTTVENEKSTPVRIREMVARGVAYRDHLKKMRREFRAAATDREAMHNKLVDNGEGPVTAKEVEQLQKSKWDILLQDEAELRKLLTEAQTVHDNRVEEFVESQRLLVEYHEGLVARFITDFVLSSSTAKAKADADPELTMLRQIAFEIEQQASAIRQMVREFEESLRGIVETKANLSKQWRTF